LRARDVPARQARSDDEAAAAPRALRARVDRDLPDEAWSMKDVQIDAALLDGGA
jgi:hypothetical protein